MFRFTREKILPLFLQSGLTITELARKAGIAYKTAQRAIDGKKVAAPIVQRVANILKIDAVKFIANYEGRLK